MGLDNLKNGLLSAVGAIKANPVETALVTGGVVAATAASAVALSRRKGKKGSKRKSTRKKSYTSRGRRRTRRRRTPRTAGKGKDRSTKRIRYTKRGQPYVIMKSGKARFIKLNSARRSHKQKGGRY